METKKYQKTITIIVLLQGISILCVEKKEHVLKKNHDSSNMDNYLRIICIIILHIITKLMIIQKWLYKYN